MNVWTVGGSVLSLAAALAAVLAAATVWLLLSDPVGVTRALSDGSTAGLAQVLAGALAAAMRALLAWL